MRWTTRRRLLTGLLLAPAVLGAGSPARAQFSVSPVILPLEPVGAPLAASVTVRNEGEAPLQFRFYAGDFDQAEAGSHTYAAAGTLPHSCAGRLSVVPDGATLAPGERQDLVVTMAPGPGTCWSGVFVETRAWGAEGVSVGQRVMVKAYGIAPGASIAGTIAAVAARAAADSVDVDVEFANEGARPLRPEGRVELRALSGEVLAAYPVEAFSALPGRRRRFAVRLPAALPPGRYLAVPILEIGAADLVGGQAPFRIAADAGADAGAADTGPAGGS